MTCWERIMLAQARWRIERETAKNLLEPALRDVSHRIFEQHPSLQGFSWTQYTPYFNDGDPCLFSCHSDCPSVWFGEYDEGAAYEGDYETGNPDFTPEQDAAGRAVVDALCAIDDDLYQDAFGDGVRVKVTREGIEVERFDHD